MRLLVIVNSLGAGGAEKLVFDMIPEYQKQGIDVELLVFEPEGQLLEGQKISAPIHYSPYSLYSPRNILFLNQFLKNYDVAHVHLFPSFYWAALSMSKTPLIFSEHSPNNKRRKFFYWPIEQIIYRRYKKIVSISEEAFNKVKSWTNLNAKRLELIPNGIPLDKFYNAEPVELDIPKDAKRLIMVSRFDPVKDHETVVKSLPYLDENVHLIFVGVGKTQEKIKALVQSLELEDRVHFLGFRSDVANLLKSSDITVMSSHFEGLSLFTLEAMASGKPLVGSRVEGLTNLLDGVGVLFEHQNEKELAEKINQLLENEEYYNTTSKQCLNKVEEYDITKTVSSYIRLYNQCVD